MKKVQRLFFVLLAAVMLLALLPTAAYAADVEWNSSTAPTSIQDGDTIIVSGSASGPFTVPNGVYNLTLVGDTPSTSITDAWIDFAHTSTINLTIRNLSITAGTASASSSIPISHPGGSTSTLNLTLDNASLIGGSRANGGPGIQSGNGNVNITAIGTVSITGGDGSNNGGTGIYVERSLQINGTLTVTGGGGSSGRDGIGIWITNNSLTVAENASLTAIGEYGVWLNNSTQPILLEGTLNAVATQNTSTRGNSVKFLNPAAVLTVQDFASDAVYSNITITKDFTDSNDYEFVSTGGVDITTTQGSAISSVTAGTVKLHPKLTVINGSGSDFYEPGSVVQIVADTAPLGQIFDKWTGGDDSIFTPGSRTSEDTNITMPATTVTLTATYVSSSNSGNSGSGSNNNGNKPKIVDNTSSTGNSSNIENDNNNVTVPPAKEPVIGGGNSSQNDSNIPIEDKTFGFKTSWILLLLLLLIIVGVYLYYKNRKNE